GSRSQSRCSQTTREYRHTNGAATKKSASATTSTTRKSHPDVSQTARKISASTGIPMAKLATIAPVQYPLSRSKRSPHTGQFSFIVKIPRQTRPCRQRGQRPARIAGSLRTSEVLQEGRRHHDRDERAHDQDEWHQVKDEGAHHEDRACAIARYLVVQLDAAVDDHAEPDEHHDAERGRELRARALGAKDDPRERGRRLIYELRVREEHEQRDEGMTARAAKPRGRVHRARSQKPKEDRRDRRRDHERIERSLQQVHAAR